MLRILLCSSLTLLGAIPESPDTPFKLATFEAKGKPPALGMVLNGGKVIVEIAGANAHVAKKEKLSAVKIPAADMRELIEQYGAVNKRLYQIANYFARQDAKGLAFAYEPSAIRFLAPVKYPWNLLAVAANYKAHAEGMGAIGNQRPGGFNAAAAAKVDPDRDAPVFFAKSPRSCIIDPGEAYYIPEGRDRIDWEGEMAIIIGKPAYMVSKQTAHDYVFGYSILFDLSDRGGRKREVSMFPGANWFEGKSTDRGAPFGPVIVPKEFLPNFNNLRIVTKVNGVVKQDGTTKDLIWQEHHMISYLTSILTLYPGDVISTGTPSGTGMERQEFLKPGDSVTIDIEGIGSLTTPFQSYRDRKP